MNQFQKNNLIIKTREEEKQELYRTIWNIANKLRSNIVGWDFKNYVLGFLFYRYISENIQKYFNNIEHDKKNLKFEYANLDDQTANQFRIKTIEQKGFFILPSELFVNVLKKIENKKIAKTVNVILNQVFYNIENSAKNFSSESSVKNLFADIDLKSKKLGNDTYKRNNQIINILKAINNMKINDYQNNLIDTFGDAYEYLINMYCSNAGKSGGEFFTPQEVSELLARLTLKNKKKINKVYDPAAGSGSLLLKFVKILGKKNILDGIYGQEINLTAYNLCRINMFLHDISWKNFDIKLGDTLTDPKNDPKIKFDVIVSNPPYSIKWIGDNNSKLINDPRFKKAGVLAPKAKADLAFVLHSLYYLDNNGIGAIVLYPGVLYRRGIEQKIRKYLVNNNYVDAVIELPKNLFFGTTISTAILIIKKNKKTKNVFFFDASNYFVKANKKNKLTFQNLNDIIDIFFSQKNITSISCTVNINKIKANNYDLSVFNYVKKSDKISNINIKKLNAEIATLVNEQQLIRNKINKIIFKIKKT